MAKNDNTLFWVAGLGLAGYLYYQYTQSQAALAPGASTTPNASTGVLALLPAPASQSAAPVVNQPAGNAPNPNVVNITNLVPAAVDPVSNAPVLAPGQTLAVNSNGTPVINSAGQPMVFQGQAPIVYSVNPQAMMEQNYVSSAGMTPSGKNMSTPQSFAITNMPAEISGECL